MAEIRVSVIHATPLTKKLLLAYQKDMEYRSESAAGFSIIAEFFKSMPKERIERLLAIAERPEEK